MDMEEKEEKRMGMEWEWLRMDKNGWKSMGRHGKGIGREWREITIELLKLPQDHRERRTRFPGTKYFYPTLSRVCRASEKVICRV
jgi:hypothetical protein